MRLPVTSSRRCEQITAFGASDVPDVKISAQSVSGPGSIPGSSVRDRRERVVEIVADHGRPVGDAGLGEPVRDEHRRELARDRREQRLVPRLGDDEPAVGVLRRRGAGARPAGCG